MTNRKTRIPVRHHQYEGSSSGSKNVAMKFANEDEPYKTKLDLNGLPNAPSSRYRNSDVHDANNPDANPDNWIGKDFDDQDYGDDEDEDYVEHILSIKLVSAVEEFHKLSSHDLSKLIKEAENGTIRYTKRNGSLLEINMEILARNLGLHLISKLLTFKRDEQHLRYLLSGVRLFHGLYDIANRHLTLEQVLLEDMSSIECVVDMIFFIIVFLSNFKQKLHAPIDKVIFPLPLLASSLYLLKACVSSQWHDIINVLLVHPQVDVFTSVVFHAVRVVINILQVKLSHTHNVDEVHRLSFHCEASLEFIHSLCQQRPFRERLVKNKNLCEEGGVLWLVQDILKLPQCEDSRLMAVVSKLKSKVLSIMVLLCEVESISFLDLAATTTEGLDLAKSTICEVLELLKIMFCGGVNGVSTYNPKGILQLNAMQLLELLSDDSYFRSYIVSKFTEVLTLVFLLPHGEFLSRWCSSNSEPTEDDVTVNYDSFAASGKVLGVMSASRGPKYIFNNSRTSQIPFAHKKTSSLVKIVANLTCYVPDLCKEEKGFFLNKFFWCLQKRINSPDGVAERVTVASRNLRTLSVHAGSLTSGYVNDDDVNLLRLFILQLEKLITPQEASIHRVKEVHNRGQFSSPRPQISTPDECNIIGNRNEVGAIIRGVNESVRDAINIEAIGSDLSNMQLKHDSDRMNVDGVLEDENVGGFQSEEKQLKKRKRNIMNDVQINLIENALQNEPQMQRRASSVQLWADKLSRHGSEITSSQLKNWLNNRKAKLARATTSPDSTPASKFLDPSSYGPQGAHQKDVRGSVLRICGNKTSKTVNVPTRSFTRRNGQYVVVVDEEGKEIGKGRIHLANGTWFDKDLQESGLCVVDVTDLKVDEKTALPHLCDATGSTFEDAKTILQKMRILWDSNKLLLIR